MHKDIVMRYAGWLSLEFKKIENKADSDELSNEGQILFLIYRKR